MVLYLIYGISNTWLWSRCGSQWPCGFCLHCWGHRSIVRGVGQRARGKLSFTMYVFSQYKFTAYLFYWIVLFTCAFYFVIIYIYNYSIFFSSFITIHSIFLKSFYFLCTCLYNIFFVAFYVNTFGAILAHTTSLYHHQRALGRILQIITRDCELFLINFLFFIC